MRRARSVAPARWSGLIGAGLAVFAARCREIHLHAGDVPILDQWKVEGADIIQPWLAGTLGPADFFQRHHEHLPVWTRLLAWLELIVSGQWDPRVQMAVNAALHAGFVVLVLRWLWSALEVRAAVIAGALLMATAVLPASWENMTWGFQSQFPLALLCLFLHVNGSLAHPPGSWRWGVAQIAGVAGLFTLAGMATAPLAVALVLLWTAAPRRDWAAPLALALAGVVLQLALGSGAVTSAATELHVHSLSRFLYAWFVQLGWPVGTLLLHVPVAALAWHLFGRRDAAPFDRIVLALGLWAVLQAAAIGYARGAGWVGYVSRYGDLLAVGLIANFLALVRLHGPAGFPRILSIASTAVWLAVVGSGLYTLNTTAHTHYFHEHSAAHNATRREGVLAYVRNGDLAPLSSPEARELVYPVPTEVARLLDYPGFRALMPAVAGPGSTGTIIRSLQANWMWLATLGLVGIAFGLATAWHRDSPLPTLSFSADPRQLFFAGSLALVAGAGMFLWPHPWLFGEARRKAVILQASGTIAPLEFEAFTSPAFPATRAVGAARVDPGDIRNLFHGTHMSGPENEAELRSASFVLVTPRLIVPFAGHPRAPGVALQVVVEDDQGAAIHVYTCADPDSADVNFWEIDTSAFQGKPARIVLVDHSTAADGWIAAATPQYAWKPGQGAARAEAWSREQTAVAQRNLGEISVTFALGCIWGLRRRSKPAR